MSFLSVSFQLGEQAQRLERGDPIDIQIPEPLPELTFGRRRTFEEAELSP